MGSLEGPHRKDHGILGSGGGALVWKLVLAGLLTLVTVRSLLYLLATVITTPTMRIYHHISQTDMKPHMSPSRNSIVFTVPFSGSTLGCGSVTPAFLSSWRIPLQT